MEKIVFKYYTDPGHGWYAVKRALLEKLGILQSISTYSYQRGATVYLEEDCDASVFFKALDNAGVTWGYLEKHTDKRHPIRSYDMYKA